MMKDYVNHRKKRQGQTRKAAFWFILVILMAMTAGLGFFAYDKGGVNLASLKEMGKVKLASFWPQSFDKEKVAAELKKTARTTSEAAKPIHFAFYDELPKAQLDYKSKAEETEELAEKEQPATVTPAAAEVAASAPTPAPVKTSVASAVSEKSIEQELSADLSAIKGAEVASNSNSSNASAGTYILQLGIFHNQEAANRYRSALQSAGLKVDLVKAKVGKEMVYRLQQGPYNNQEQIKAAKKRLTDRGVTCDIRKLPQYEI